MMGICQHSLYVGLATFLLLADGGPASAGLVVSAIGLPVQIDFDGFRGSGFAPNPAAGQLDSNLWRITGLSDGAGQFGGTHLTGDFARGASNGGVSTGGIYGFNVGSGSTANWVLGFQPIGNDLTPGEATLRVINGTGGSIERVDLEYQVWMRNDGDRSSSFNFAYSFDDESYQLLSDLNITSPLAADSPPQWVSVSRMASLTGLSLGSGSSLFLQWRLDDVGGSGVRDEWGLDNIEIAFGGSMSPVPEPSTWVMFSMLCPALFWKRRRLCGMYAPQRPHKEMTLRQKLLAAIEGIPLAQF